jgi:hypothetical protein
MMTTERRGAYGLHLPGLERDAGALLVQAPKEWAPWHIEHCQGSGQPSEFLRDTRARVRTEPDGWVDVDLQTRTSTLNLPDRPGCRELVHPYLGSTAVVAAHWCGWESFHAGAFLLAEKAWAILGDKEAGKSSLLACLALCGTPILTDDVLVLRGAVALAGPRCIDLREASARQLDAGDPLGVVGSRPRWRMEIASVPAEVPLGGWIYLDWGKKTHIQHLPASQLLPALLARLALRATPRDPQGLMDLLELPALSFTREQQVEALNESTQALLHLLADL